jgi:hypothetical protein
MKPDTVQNAVRQPGIALGLVCLVALAGGCQTAKVAHPLTADMGGSAPDAQLNFWHTLATRPVTSNDEAFHGLLLYADGKDDSADYSQRVQTLKSRKMLPGSFNALANEAIQRGVLAVAVCRILEVRGGVMMHLTGAAPRYAMRELEFLELYPPSGTYQTFSGSEFLGIIGRMEDYQRGNPASVPAAVLPGEMRGGATTQPAN